MVLEKTLESPLDCKEINPKGNQTWIFIDRTDAEAEAPVLWPPDAKKKWTHWKRLWCWESLKARGEGNNREWNGWMASPTRWIWVWAGSGSWWWTGKPVVLQSMGSQRVGHDWARNYIECWEVKHNGIVLWILLIESWIEHIFFNVRYIIIISIYRIITR